MAIDSRRKLNQKINNLIHFSAQRIIRLFEFSRQGIFGLHWSEILSTSDHRRTLSGLSRIAIFALFVSASPMVSAYGISIPNDSINDSVIVRLQTSSIPSALASSRSDTEITNWWVQAGSTGSGSGQNDYFTGVALEAPILIPIDGDLDINAAGIKGGTSNALVTNLPMNGEKVFLSIWLKRKDQSWKRVMTSVITASSSTTPTKKVEHSGYGRNVFFFGRYVWDRTSMASHYQVWVNDYTDTNVHNKWYRHNEVCMNAQAIDPDKCAVSFPASPGFGTFWVRAWNVHGRHGTWSRAVTFDGSEKRSGNSQ